jgi:hypothetical protein
MEWLSKHVIAATDTRAIIEELLETVFSAVSVQRRYITGALARKDRPFLSPERAPHNNKTVTVKQ